MEEVEEVEKWKSGRSKFEVRAEYSPLTFQPFHFSTFPLANGRGCIRPQAIVELIYGGAAAGVWFKSEGARAHRRRAERRRPAWRCACRSPQATGSSRDSAPLHRRRQRGRRRRRLLRRGGT